MLARQRESLIEEGHLMPDHVQYDDLDSAQICGIAGDWLYQGEECDPHRSKVCGEQEKLCGSAFLGAGLFCLDGGPDEQVIRDYIRHQEQEDRRVDQLSLV